MKLIIQLIMMLIITLLMFSCEDSPTKIASNPYGEDNGKLFIATTHVVGYKPWKIYVNNQLKGSIENYYIYYFNCSSTPDPLSNVILIIPEGHYVVKAVDYEGTTFTGTVDVFKGKCTLCDFAELNGSNNDYGRLTIATKYNFDNAPVRIYVNDSYKGIMSYYYPNDFDCNWDPVDSAVISIYLSPGVYTVKAVDAQNNSNLGNFEVKANDCTKCDFGELSGNNNNQAPEITSFTPDTGVVGDLVTIYGKNFGAARNGSSVRFNSGEVMDYNYWSDTELRVYVPDNAVSGNIVVTTTYGTIRYGWFEVWVPNLPSYGKVIAMIPSKTTVYECELRGKTTVEVNGAWYISLQNGYQVNSLQRPVSLGQQYSRSYTVDKTGSWCIIYITKVPTDYSGNTNNCKYKSKQFFLLPDQTVIIDEWEEYN